MARHLSLGTYTRRAGRASAAAVTLFAGGQQLGRKAHGEGAAREANPFRDSTLPGWPRSLRQDRELAAMGWDAGWQEADTAATKGG